MSDETEKAPRGEALAALLLTPEMPSVFVSVVDGPDRGLSRALVGARLSIGSSDKNDLVLADPTVSRFHCELVAGDGPLRVRDLASTNGTFLDSVPVADGYVRSESTLRIGQTMLSIRPGEPRAGRAISGRTRFGRLVGRSVAMRSLFTDLAEASHTTSTVLLHGETGTGKEEAALAIHEESDREGGPFVVVDCGSLTGQLIESELFGHERGAFTNAVASRPGAFEVASGGTLFVDEIGELRPADQTRLLRVLENRTIRRVGSNEVREVDVRVIAATHRDLRRAINEGRFREDLYYRLAVFEIRLPPLRERTEDIPLLASYLLERIGGKTCADEVLTDELVEMLVRSSWPGNVRQLRNYLERVVHLRETPSPPGSIDPRAVSIDASLAYDTARRLALDEFERRYLAAVLDAAGDNVTDAAKRAGITRTSFHRLLRRHKIRE